VADVTSVATFVWRKAEDLIETGNFMQRVLPILVVLAASGCSVAPTGVNVHDPYEATNRQVHAFNKRLNAAVSGADDGTESGPLLHPEIAALVINFSDNAGGPGMVLNGLLQGDIASAATNAFRFVLNTTVGIGGLLDPSDAIGLPEVETDFAQTMAVWGAPEGAYLELPLLGPSTQRDIAGRIVDAVIDPLGVYGTQEIQTAATVARVGTLVLKRDQYGDTIDSVLNESADSYASARLIYLQNRRFELGLEVVDDVDPYADLYGE
jgi:phospholipid-binding lipoprotein MlaA